MIYCKRLTSVAPRSYVLLAKPAKPLADFDSDADEDDEEEDVVAYCINAELHTMIADARCEHPAQIRLVIDNHAAVAPAAAGGPI